jgi:hypothetical protein
MHPFNGKPGQFVPSARTRRAARANGRRIRPGQDMRLRAIAPPWSAHHVSSGATIRPIMRNNPDKYMKMHKEFEIHAKFRP